MEKGFDSWILVCVVFRFDCWSGSEVVCVVQLSGGDDAQKERERLG